jgi:hypothetical protein
MSNNFRTLKEEQPIDGAKCIVKTVHGICVTRPYNQEDNCFLHANPYIGYIIPLEDVVSWKYMTPQDQEIINYFLY